MNTSTIFNKLLSLHQSMESLTDPNAVKILTELLNLIEELASENEAQKELIQKQRDEINKLKKEQGKPNIKPNKKPPTNFSSENERKKAEESGEEGKKEGFKLDKLTLEKLEEKRIPAEILKNLDKLKGKKYDSKAEFLKTVEDIVGGEAVKLYGDLLTKYARYTKRNGKAKVPEIKIDRVEKCKVDPELLPDDAEFKGNTPKVVQDLIIKSDNVLFKREIYWSPSLQKTYIGDVPKGYEQDYGPNIKSQLPVFKYVNNMSIPKIKEFCNNFGIIISETYISRRLTNEVDVFHTEKSQLYEASLEVSAWQQIDDTGSRMNGKNYYTHIVCNDLCTVFFTTPRKDRLTILDILRNFESRSFVFNDETFDLLKQLRVSQKVIAKVEEVTERDKELSEEDMEEILVQIFADSSKGKISRIRIMEAAAIASYHRETGVPAVKVLVSDDAPQFKLIIDEHMLCWIHEGRHYKKLRPVVLLHQNQLEVFRKSYWEYYRNLYNYKQNPSFELAETLSSEFDKLFSTKSGYNELDDRIAKTKLKEQNLLTVLKHPEIPLHNNRSENGARVQKRREDVSLHTMTEEGTKAKDTMMTIVESCKKLGVSAYKFIDDRISRKFEMPSLAELIKARAASVPIQYDSS